MALIELELPWEHQPQGPVELGEYRPRYVWSGANPRLLLDGPAAGTFSGTPTITQAGQAVAHNGSSQYENWTISEVNAFPFVLGGSFVVTNATAGIRTAFGVGGAASTGGLYSGVGHYTAGNIASWARVQMTASHAEISGPAAVVGKRYNVIRISRGQTDHVMYVNGERFTSAVDVGIPNDSWQSVTVGACVRGGTPLFHGNQSVHLGFFGRTDPGDEWARRWSENEFSIFAPQSIWVPVSAGGGTPTLTVPDSSHAHTLDNVVLTSSTALVVQDMAHGHALDAPTLSTGIALAVADLAHAHALENVTLSTTGATSLTVADLAHGHALDAVVLTSQTDLAAADMAHGHALDGVTLTLGGISLVIAEIMHAHALDAVALTLDTYLAVADLLHGHAIDNVLVSIPGGTLDLILKILVNRQELNPATGTFTLYDNDGTTVLYTTSAWADAAGTVPYSGGALRRIDALF